MRALDGERVLRLAGRPCPWCVGGQLLPERDGSECCLQCGRPAEAGLAPLPYLKRVGHSGLVAGRRVS